VPDEEIDRMRLIHSGLLDEWGPEVNGKMFDMV